MSNLEKGFIMNHNKEESKDKPLKVADGSQPIKLFLMAFFGLATFLVLLKVVSLLEQLVINTSK